MKNWHFLTIMLFCSFFLTFQQVYAQPAAGSWGIGIQIGEPNGLLLKHYNPRGASFDALFAWDLDDYFFVNLHAIWEKSLSSSPDFNFFYGPGAFVGFLDRNRRFYDDDEVILGVSGNVGLNVYIDRFEIYLQVTPRLSVVERTDADVGGGVGFRFFF
ncbi:MAG: hypothetical protein ACK4TA_25615 [Saprospiraceae bacterium]